MALHIAIFVFGCSLPWVRALDSAAECGENPLEDDKTILIQNQYLGATNRGTGHKQDELATPNVGASFASFIAFHGREYLPGSPEFELRQKLYEQRAVEVDSQNKQPRAMWTAKLNHLADRTESELSRLLGWRGHAFNRKAAETSVSALQEVMVRNASIPNSFSWSHLAAIQRSHDQGQCGSCWAVATETMLNAADEIAGNNRTFSAQDLVNCVPNPHNCGGKGGCDGSTVELAMDYVVKHGLRTAQQSPYQGKDAGCYHSLLSEADKTASATTPIHYDDDLQAMIAVGPHHAPVHSPGYNSGVLHWIRLPENQKNPVMEHLVQYGPLAVSVAAHGWFLYSSGVFNNCNAVVNHAVVLFGYGHDSATGADFWDIKNSWGTGWGDNGNMKLFRDSNVPCGIDHNPAAGTGCDGGPSQVTVCGTCGIFYDVVAVKHRQI
jgi:cathepsin L